MAAKYDVIIIGVGPAGLAASLFTARAQLKTLVFGSTTKAMLAQAQVVGNALGLDGMSGLQIANSGIAQAKKYGAEVQDKEVVNIVKKNSSFLVKTADAKDYEAKAIILASGVSYKGSGVFGEEKFVGRGVHYCVACDGIFFKKKKVYVVGSGNYAAEEAIELTAYTKDISIVSNGAEFEISPQLMKELKRYKIKLREDIITEFKGDKMLKSAKVNGKEETVDGIFVAIGMASALGFALKLGLEMSPDKSFIVVDKEMKTTVDGIFAAGGCTGGNIQIAKSAGEGCNAAIAVIKKLKGISAYVDHT